MAFPTVQARLFLLVAGSFTLAMGLSLLLVRNGISSAQWYVAPVIGVAWLAALAVSWLAVRAWSAPAGRNQETASGAGKIRSQDLEADLAQRDLLLREIHHRVKNNLQMISSLLSLQAGRIRSPRIRRVFSGAQNRVLAMAVLHRHLYERTNWAEVDFQAFLNDLVRHLSADHNARTESRVRFYLNAPVVSAGPDVAIPVGLIVTEAVSNALVHAFAGTRDPQIFIRICKTDGTFEMSVEDNGVGIAPDAPALNGQGGLGFTLLHGLAAQLEGELSVSPRSEGGTRVLLKFPDSQRGSRTADDGHRSAGRPSAPS